MEFLATLTTARLFSCFVIESDRYERVFVWFATVAGFGSDRQVAGEIVNIFRAWNGMNMCLIIKHGKIEFEWMSFHKKQLCFLDKPSRSE